MCHVSGQRPALKDAALLLATGSPGAVTVIVAAECTRFLDLATNVVPWPAASLVEHVSVRTSWLGTARPQFHPGLATPPK
jgi:hypothetical protein